MKLRVALIKALFSRNPVAKFERWQTEQFRQQVNRAAGVDVHIHLDGQELSTAFKAYTDKSLEAFAASIARQRR
jgi:hypothetical protein